MPWLLTFLIASWSAPALSAQEPESAAGEPERPRIILVLGGGGARGSAHVGVLQVLEELRVPVDVIVGTSMGAVVGGLYAAGHSPTELKRIFQTLDWNLLLSGEPPRGERSFRRKAEDWQLTVDFEIGLRNWKLLLPRGLVSDQNLNFSLKRFTFPVAGVRDFDELPTPFRAVAADIETGEVVVLNRGSLPDALRASMSVPGLFSPMELEGRLLVDGGVALNLPIEVATRLEPDVIIAVDVGTPLYQRSEIASAFGVAGQLSRLFTRLEADRQLDLLDSGDVLVTPDLGDIGFSSFDRILEGIPAGEAAARARIGELARYSLSPQEYADFALRRVRPGNPYLRIDFVRVENSRRVSSEVVRSRIRLQPGEALDFNTLRTDLARIYGLGWYERVDYRLEERGDSLGLVVAVHEKSWGPNTFRVGLNLSDDLGGRSGFQLLVDHTWFQLNDRGGEWKNRIRLGEIRGLFSELYQPLDYSGRFFVAPFVDFRREIIDAFQEGVRLSDYRGNSQGIGVDVGANLGGWGEVRFGILQEELDADPRSEDLDVPPLDVKEGALRASVTVDQLDDPYFPTDGGFLRVEWLGAREGLGSDSAYDRVSVSGSRVSSWGRSVITLAGELGASSGTDLPLHRQFALGGFLRLSGIDEERVAGNHAGLGRLTYQWRFRDLAGFAWASSVRFGLSLEAGGAWPSRSDVQMRDLVWSGSAFAAVKTLLGPAYLAYGRSEGGRDAWYFFLGRPL
jgi:NTE family protein